MQSIIRRPALRRYPNRCLQQICYDGHATGFCHTKSTVLIKRSLFESRLSLPEIDEKWRLEWKDRRRPIKKDANKMYILPMFPYPSGALHLGHLRVYTISDALARFWTMKGRNVVHPMGWDAFGLPAENAAIDRGIDPAVWTEKNIQNMKSQIIEMNGSWDWDREITTCDPNFYKHTQTLFLLLHEHGMAYQAESMVNYDPVDKTVLANEQVDANGHSWRSGAKVEKRQLKQWFLRISAFREQLLQDLDHLSKGGMWPERVLAMQKNWLGKSQGARVKFSVSTYDQSTQPAIEVFTTRPDTLFGAQYIALAATHPIVQNLANHSEELQTFLKTLPDLDADSKAGYLLPNIRAINPLSSEASTPDASKASLPIFVAPYVVGDYGDGAVMGVPAHDKRDHAFWKHNNPDAAVRYVIAPTSGSSKVSTNEPYVHHGRLTSNNGPFSGQTTAQATENIIKLLEAKKLGSAAETWRLRDWLVSRQRYWGTPIPIIHCDNCGAVPVPEEDLPVKLPQVDGHWLNGKAGNPLDDAHDWKNVPCPKCGTDAKRDTDTMDTFVDSSWYFMRYTDAGNKTVPFSPEAANATLPVDIYVGGVEHAILHLLYARFISKFLATTLWPAGCRPDVLGEPFKKLLTQGMVHGKTYSDPSTGQFLKPNEVDLSIPSRPIVCASGKVANVSFEKMSKSKYNGVDPTVCMSKYGADATRAHILFQAPVTEVLEWDEEKIAGITRWLNRVYDCSGRFRYRKYTFRNFGIPTGSRSLDDPFTPKAYFLDAAEYISSARKGKSLHPNITASDILEMFEVEMKLWRSVQQTITSVGDAYSKTYSLNTIVSDLMALTNLIIETLKFEVIWDGKPTLSATTEGIAGFAFEALLQMMAPITPAVSEECWEFFHKRDVPLLGPLTQWASSGALCFTYTPGTRSIFESPFPEPDGTLDLLIPSSQQCVVQVNGKFRFMTYIPNVPSAMTQESLRGWVIKELSATHEGKDRFGSGNRQIDINKAKKIIVVQNGKLVNFVI